MSDPLTDPKDPYHFEARASALTRKFWEDVLALSAEEARSWKDGEELVAMAKAICEAQGREPDNVVIGIPHGAIMRDGKGQAALVHPIRPNWWHCLREAVAAREFMETPEAKDLPLERVVDFMGAIRDIAAGR